MTKHPHPEGVASKVSSRTARRTSPPLSGARSVPRRPRPRLTSKPSPRPRLAFIGAGRVGSALARELSRRGWRIAAVASARTSSARRLARLCGARIATTDPARAAQDADIVIIAVPDRAISEVVRRLAALPGGTSQAATGLPNGAARRGGSAGEGSAGAKLHPSQPLDMPGRIALHTAGALGAEALDGLRGRGWSVGSFHPLSAFPPPSSAPPVLEGTVVAIDGDRRARRTARYLAASLDAEVMVQPSHERARYHLAACFASNYVVTLASEAVDLLSRSGLSRGRALRALLPLLRSTLANLGDAGLPGALTGPVARGDAETLARHASALRDAAPDLKSLHAFLVRRTARLALASHRIDAAAARRLEGALLGALGRHPP